MFRLTIKDNIWYIYNFWKAVGNNIRVLFLIFHWFYWQFNAAVIACFSYFKSNIFSVITPLAFDNDYFSLIQIFRLHTWFLFAIFSFFCVEVKSEFLYQIFYWKLTSRVHNGFFNEMLTSKNRRVGFSSELRHTRFHRPRDSKKC